MGGAVAACPGGLSKGVSLTNKYTATRANIRRHARWSRLDAPSESADPATVNAELSFFFWNPPLYPFELGLRFDPTVYASYSCPASCFANSSATSLCLLDLATWSTRGLRFFLFCMRMSAPRSTCAGTTLRCLLPLLDHGASINSENKAQSTLLHGASANGRARSSTTFKFPFIDETSVCPLQWTRRICRCILLSTSPLFSEVV